MYPLFIPQLSSRIFTIGAAQFVVQEALEKLMKDRTTIIIAHRLATIRKVDKIFVINKGQIIESGTHEELLSKGDGMYNNLVKLQFELK